MTKQREDRPFRKRDGEVKKRLFPEDYTDFPSEREDIRNRLNRQLRRARGIPEERTGGKESLSYAITTDIAYMLDEIQRGPVFMAPQTIRRANDLITEFESKLTALGASD